jgi:para-nitrobenzyl esterase
MMNSKLSLLSFALLLVSCAEPSPAPLDQVTIETGSLKGVTEGGVTAFKGIPYAAPPIGDLRWQPPQSAANWSGTRDSSAYGPDCKQLPFPGDAAPLGVESSED